MRNLTYWFDFHDNFQFLEDQDEVSWRFLYQLVVGDVSSSVQDNRIPLRYNLSFSWSIQVTAFVFSKSQRAKMRSNNLKLIKNGRLKVDGHILWPSLVQSGRSKRVKVDGPYSGWSRESGRSWVKVDGHSTKSGRSLTINRRIEVDGRKVPKWTVQKYQSKNSFPNLEI